MGIPTDCARRSVFYFFYSHDWPIYYYYYYFILISCFGLVHRLSLHSLLCIFDRSSSHLSHIDTLSFLFPFAQRAHKPFRQSWPFHLCYTSTSLVTFYSCYSLELFVGCVLAWTCMGNFWFISTERERVMESKACSGVIGGVILDDSAVILENHNDDYHDLDPSIHPHSLLRKLQHSGLPTVHFISLSLNFYFWWFYIHFVS